MTIAALCAMTASAADINVRGAQQVDPMVTDASVKVATHDHLRNPTGLINKNTLAMDNNVNIARSNIAFNQNDRLALGRKVEELISSNKDMDSAVLSRNILHAVSAPDTDRAMMSKASAIVTASRAGDHVRMSDNIRDLVNAAMKSEQAIQAQVPQGVILLTGTKDILRQPSAVINKNLGVSDTQVNVARSQIVPQSNDAVAMTGAAKVADVIASGSSINVENPQVVRMGFLFQKQEQDDKKEQFGLWGAGLGFGWRYPLSYWNMYGAGLYGGGCGLGLSYGSFFYC